MMGSGDDARCSDLSANEVVACIDGAYCDNTGIVHAVAAGANEVLVVEASGDGQDSSMLFDLFEPATKPGCACFNFRKVLYLPDRIQIFEEDADSIKKQCTAFPKLETP